MGANYYKITSPQNEKFKSWKSLSSSSGIKQHNQFFLMGEKLVREFLSDPASMQMKGLTLIAQIVSDHSLMSVPEAVPTYELPTALFKELDTLGTRFNLLLIEFETISLWNDHLDEKKILLPLASKSPDRRTVSPKIDLRHSLKNLDVICPLGDPQNLGALVRSAVAFNARCILLLPQACHPYHPKSIKASAGAVLAATFYKISIEDLFKINSLGVRILALDMNEQNIDDLQKPLDSSAGLALLVGEEGPGLDFLPADLPVQKIRIPIQNTESLNAVVAASIALFQLQKS
ncbi:MAG: TrmH family RNA methyltransferase [Pseudobdellovibrionaceae bacterium]